MQTIASSFWGKIFANIRYDFYHNN